MHGNTLKITLTTLATTLKFHSNHPEHLRTWKNPH